MFGNQHSKHAETHEEKQMQICCKILKSLQKDPHRFLAARHFHRSSRHSFGQYCARERLHGFGAFALLCRPILMVSYPRDRTQTITSAFGLARSVPIARLFGEKFLRAPSAITAAEIASPPKHGHPMFASDVCGFLDAPGNNCPPCRQKRLRCRGPA